MSSRAKTTSTENEVTTSTADSVTPDAAISENVVAEYLQAHPDFFQHNEDLLQNLQVPHQAGTASLIERQVIVLREKSRDLEEQLNGLIRTARGNEQIVTRLQRFTLELMRADCLDSVIATCQEILRDDFNSNFVTLRIIGGDDTMHFVAPDNKMLKHFDKLFVNKKPICGRLKDDQQAFLFDKNSNSVKSAALIPLVGTERIGILALGSEDESRLHPGMGTVFISHLGELISTSLTRHLR